MCRSASSAVGRSCRRISWSRDSRNCNLGSASPPHPSGSIELHSTMIRHRGVKVAALEGDAIRIRLSEPKWVDALLLAGGVALMFAGLVEPAAETLSPGFLLAFV